MASEVYGPPTVASSNDDTLGGVIRFAGWVVTVLSVVLWLVMFTEMGESGYGSVEYTDIQKWSMSVSCLTPLSLGLGLVGLGQLLKRR